MYKKIMTLLLFLCLIIQPAIQAEAKDKAVTIGSASITSAKVTVSGSTEALAVMVRVTDSADSILAMQSFGVSTDGSFFAEIEGTFAVGTYNVAVADYEGGSWATQNVKIAAPPSGGGGSYPGGGGGGGSSSGGSSTTVSTNTVSTNTVSSNTAVTPNSVSGNTVTNGDTGTGDKITSKKTNATYRVIEGGDTDGKIGCIEYVAPIKKKKSYNIAAKVTIDNITYKVTRIADNAFKGNNVVQNVNTGKNVTTIGENAFAGCKKLKSVTLGKNVTTLEDKAFSKTKSLKKVNIKSKKLKAENIGKSVWAKSGKNITFTVPASKYKSYKKIFGKYGTVKKK